MDMDHPWLICMLILVLIVQRRWRRSVCAWVCVEMGTPVCRCACATARSGKMLEANPAAAAASM